MSGLPWFLLYELLLVIVIVVVCCIHRIQSGLVRVRTILKLSLNLREEGFCHDSLGFTVRVVFFFRLEGLSLSGGLFLRTEISWIVALILFVKLGISDCLAHLGDLLRFDRFRRYYLVLLLRRRLSPWVFLVHGFTFDILATESDNLGIWPKLLDLESGWRGHLIELIHAHCRSRLKITRFRDRLWSGRGDKAILTHCVGIIIWIFFLLSHVKGCEIVVSSEESSLAHSLDIWLCPTLVSVSVQSVRHHGKATFLTEKCRFHCIIVLSRLHTIVEALNWVHCLIILVIGISPSLSHRETSKWMHIIWFLLHGWLFLKWCNNWLYREIRYFLGLLITKLRRSYLKLRRRLLLSLNPWLLYRFLNLLCLWSWSRSLFLRRWLFPWGC